MEYEHFAQNTEISCHFTLKVHKNENFFGYFDWAIMGGATIIPRSLQTTRNGKKFQHRPKNFLFLKSYMTLKYLLIIDFPKLDPLTAAEMALCGNLGPKCQNLFPLV